MTNTFNFRIRLANKRKPSKQTDETEDSDYMPEPIKKKHQDSDDDFAPKTKVKRRVQVKPELQDNGPKKKKDGQDVWVEVFLECEEKWISVDVVSGRVHCVQEIAVNSNQCKRPVLVDDVTCVTATRHPSHMLRSGVGQQQQSKGRDAEVLYQFQYGYQEITGGLEMVGGFDQTVQRNVHPQGQGGG